MTDKKAHVVKLTGKKAISSTEGHSMHLDNKRASADYAYLFSEFWLNKLFKSGLISFDEFNKIKAESVTYFSPSFAEII